jgi:hypothetical protein
LLTVSLLSTWLLFCITVVFINVIGIIIVRDSAGFKYKLMGFMVYFYPAEK